MSNQFPPTVPQGQHDVQQGLTYVPQKSNATLIIVLGLLGVMLLPCTGIGVALLLPAVQAAREAARRTQCANNMKQIGLAMHNYHDAYGALPPAYTVDSDGRPLHSWRTLLLPFLEKQPLYAQIDLSKPWDDPANAAIGAIDVPIFMCPSMPDAQGQALSSYVAIVDASGIMTGPQQTGFRAVVDGTSNTILVTEVDRALAVPWMSPQDITMQQFVSLGPNGQGSHHPGGRNVVFADGSLKFIGDFTDQNQLRAMVTKAGGEQIEVP